LRVQRKAGKSLFTCSRCGYKIEEANKLTIESIEGTHKPYKQPSIIEVSDETAGSLSKTKVTCPKCGGSEAFWWMQQTRAADEASTRFFKCVRCEHVWREYD